MQTVWKRAFLMVASLLIMVAISACGGGATPPTNIGNDVLTPTTEQTEATPTEATGGDAVIKTASATVDGETVTILTNAEGYTLYYFTPDTAETTACTGGCATTWPPLIYDGATVTSSETLSGTLDTYTNEHGYQVRYNHNFLYTYAPDTAPGDTKGHGVGGNWFVATPDLAEKM